MKMSEHAIKRALGIKSTPPHTEGNEANEIAAPSVNAIIIEEYLTRYTPVEKVGTGVMTRTTSDIIAELADMADLDPDEVNAILIRHKYRPGRNNSGSFGWLMRHSTE